MSWVFAWIGIIVVVVQGGLIGPLTRRFGEFTAVIGGTLVLAGFSFGTFWLFDTLLRVPLPRSGWGF